MHALSLGGGSNHSPRARRCRLRVLAHPLPPPFPPTTPPLPPNLVVSRFIGEISHVPAGTAWVFAKLRCRANLHTHYAAQNLHTSCYTKYNSCFAVHAKKRGEDTIYKYIYTHTHGRRLEGWKVYERRLNAVRLRRRKLRGEQKKDKIRWRRRCARVIYYIEYFVTSLKRKRIAGIGVYTHIL